MAFGMTAASYVPLVVILFVVAPILGGDFGSSSERFAALDSNSVVRFTSRSGGLMAWHLLSNPIRGFQFRGEIP